jgi:DNA-binding transcriptional regulator GbsR (MarR family)
VKDLLNNLSNIVSKQPENNENNKKINEIVILLNDLTETSNDVKEWLDWLPAIDKDHAIIHTQYVTRNFISYLTDDEIDDRIKSLSI